MLQSGDYLDIKHLFQSLWGPASSATAGIHAGKFAFRKTNLGLDVCFKTATTAKVRRRTITVNHAVEWKCIETDVAVIKRLEWSEILEPFTYQSPIELVSLANRSFSSSDLRYSVGYGIRKKSHDQ